MIVDIFQFCLRISVWECDVQEDWDRELIFFVFDPCCHNIFYFIGLSKGRARVVVSHDDFGNFAWSKVLLIKVEIDLDKKCVLSVIE